MKNRLVVLMLLLFSIQGFTKQIPSLIPYRKGDKWGYSNREKKIIVECKYQSAHMFREGLAAVKENNKWFFINTKGKKISNIYDDVQDFREGRAPFKVDNKWGFIDRNGKEIVQPTYRYAGRFFQGRSWVMDSKRLLGVVNKKGKLIVPIIYNFFDEYEEDRHAIGAIWQKPSLYQFIKRNGKTILLTGYDYVMGLAQNRSVVRKDSLAGYINKKGKLIIPTMYYEAFFFSEGIAYVSKDSIKSIINRKGRELFRLQYSIDPCLAQYSCSRLAVRKGNKWGYIDKKNNVVIDFSYDFANQFKRGVASVKQGDKWFFIDKAGNKISECKYAENRFENFSTLDDIGYYFYDELCLVKYQGKEGYIDIKGTEYWQD
ncbi:MAG TPA: WG repeat-containing protein [Cytophagaceae bacterium]|nr:WG repeat-containing protein [Cytophagaceae bacterium]